MSIYADTCQFRPKALVAKGLRRFLGIVANDGGCGLRRILRRECAAFCAALRRALPPPLDGRREVALRGDSGDTNRY